MLTSAVYHKCLVFSCLSYSDVNLLLVCLCSPLQLAPRSDPQSLCFPPPLSSSLGARPRWPACWAATLLRESRWAGRWTVQRWQRGSWPAQRKRRADATAAAAPWVWPGSAGWKESCTPARSSITATARPSPSTGASVRPRGAGRSPGQELCVGGAGGTHLLLWSIWVWMFAEETKALCDREQHCCKCWTTTAQRVMCVAQQLDVSVLHNCHVDDWCVC